MTGLSDDFRVTLGTQDRLFLWMERLDSTYWKGQAPPGLRWARRLAEYAKRHPVRGSLVQVVRYLMVMFVVVSLLTLFHHETAVADLCWRRHPGLRDPNVL